MIPLFDNNQRKRAPVITLILILANVIVFSVQLHLARMGGLESAVFQYGFVPAHLTEEPGLEAILSIFSSMFLHGSVLHLLSNLWFLWLFGNIVEDRVGPARFLLLYLVAGIGAALAQFVINPFSPIPMVGASGAIAGILGAYLVLFPTAIIFTFVPLWFAPIIPVPAFIFLIIWFFLQIWYGIGALFATDLQGGVAWWAHFGGFVIGLWLIKRLKPRRRR